MIAEFSYLFSPCQMQVRPMQRSVTENPDVSLGLIIRRQWKVEYWIYSLLNKDGTGESNLQ
jgi:hypothetical protein